MAMTKTIVETAAPRIGDIPETAQERHRPIVRRTRCSGYLDRRILRVDVAVSHAGARVVMCDGFVASPALEL